MSKGTKEFKAMIVIELVYTAPDIADAALISQEFLSLKSIISSDVYDDSFLKSHKMETVSLERFYENSLPSDN